MAPRHASLDTRTQRFSEEHGSELIEMALVLPLYFLVIFALMSFAIVLFAYCNATYACRAAVRYAEVHSAATMQPCSAAVLEGIVDPFLWGVPAGGAAVSSQWTSSNTVGQTVTVAATLHYSSGMPFTSLQGLVISTSASGVIVH